MTIVAFKDDVMAADTQLSQHNAKFNAQKIVRLPDGGIAGGMGLFSAVYAGLKFLAEGGSEDNDRLPDVKDATILIARPDGSLWIVEDRFPAYPVMDISIAIGCGADAAKMAMQLGKSAVEAINLVIKQDIMCGEPVQWMELEATHEYGGVKTAKNNKKAKG